MIGLIITGVIVVGVGIWLGGLGNTKNPKITPNQKGGDCRTSCSDLHSQHDDLCVAERNLLDAVAHVDRMQSALYSLGASLVAVLLGTFGAATLIETLTVALGTPLVIILIIGGLVVAGVLVSALLAALIAWVTAQVVASEKRNIASELRNLKADALGNVRANCTEEEAQQCINSLFPCS